MGATMEFWTRSFGLRCLGCLIWIWLAAMDANYLVFAECPAGVIVHSPGLPALRLRDSERIIEVRPDRVLGSVWGVVSDCKHPEWPSRLVALPRDSDASAPGAAVPLADAATTAVRVGERVRLWRQDAATRIETSGAAEEGGAVGQRIKVRLARAGSDDGSAKEVVTGVVRGLGSVEILR